MSWAQLRRVGVSEAGISTWVADGYLHRRRVGRQIRHQRKQVLADLWAALGESGRRIA